VYLFEQLRNRPPIELLRHLCANIEISAANKQVSFPIHQARDIPQTIFCSRASHVAKKVVGNDDVLKPKNIDQLWRRQAAT
jgi:hypothetical protein